MKSYLQAFIESFQHTDTDLCIRLLHKIQSSEIDQSQKREKEEKMNKIYTNFMQSFQHGRNNVVRNLLQIWYIGPTGLSFLYCQFGWAH